MNKVQLLGRLVADPDVTYKENRKIYTRFRLAVDSVYKNKEGTRKTSFIPCIVWGRAAELFGNTIRKGQRILITDGHIETGEYLDDTGERQYTWNVVVTAFEYIEKKRDSEHSDFAEAFGDVSGQDIEL